MLLVQSFPCWVKCSVLDLLLLQVAGTGTESAVMLLESRLFAYCGTGVWI